MIDLGLGICHPWQNDETGDMTIDEAVAVFPDQLVYNYRWDRIGLPDYIPMNWRPTTMTPGAGVVESTRGGTWLWGNEPEDPTQGRMTPTEAAEAWSRWQARARSLGITTIAPNVQITDTYTQSTNSNGLEWLNEWVRLIGENVPDVWGVHMYWSPTADHWIDKWDDFMSAFWSRHGRGSPVAITEINAYAQPGVHATGVQLAVAQMVKTDPRLCGAFWFATHFNHWEFADLMTSGGGLTILGENWKRFNEYAGGDANHKSFLPSVLKS